MAVISALCTSADEQTYIRNAIADIAIRHDWADGTVCFFRKIGELERAAEEKHDIIIFDAAIPGVTAEMIEVRTRLPDALILPIAGADVPPTDYVRPDIMPFGLIWRPINEERVRQSLFDAFRRIREREGAGDEYFLLKSRSESKRIQYCRICYFEATEKKLSLRTPKAEYRFAGTLTAIEPKLPEQFLRCHKSFIVNSDHILNVRHDVQAVRLDCDLEIPYSKGYRKSFLEKLYGRNN